MKKRIKSIKRRSKRSTSIKQKKINKSIKRRSLTNHIKRKCRSILSSKIKKTMHEYNKGLNFSSRKQAIAVAFSIIRKKYPKCGIFMRR